MPNHSLDSLIKGKVTRLIPFFWFTLHWILDDSDALFQSGIKQVILQ